ncbi:5-oxoprolinase subunit PxpB [Imbroritus primus]|jgi:inhibitor of KinA|uniref:5-oxoprolinase subunit PxpB n=1 Tax=Imbroritus primus TaxID=3058603 RepID=A0ACD3SSR1_9BURK|nr:5-oxoprolinase subunit PxpB [Burkholderiaceae bacterium PBA]
MDVRFLSAGDTAIVVEFGDRIDRTLSDRVLQLGARVRAVEVPGVVETVPTYRSLMVHYDPLVTDSATLSEQITALLDDNAASTGAGRLWRVPACYEPTHAPDIAEVAETKGLTVDEVIRLHTETQFHIYMIGFVPGYPYMGDLPEQLVLPRRADPRIRVPAGSIAIASTMTAIYPLESPGGWHLIGTTPIRLFDAAQPRPALFSPGDKVRFEPVTAAQFDDIRAATQAGTYQVPSEALAS